MKRPLVLIVDDEEYILNALKRVLRHEAFDVETSLDAGSAMKVLSTHPVQVMISDEKMPGVSGTELMRRVRDQYPHVVRIMLSGHAELDHMIKSVECEDIFQFITKPWNDEEIRTAIREGLAQFERHH